MSASNGLSQDAAEHSSTGGAGTTGTVSENGSEQGSSDRTQQSGPTDLGCLDGMYSEVPPNIDADISGLITAYTPLDTMTFILDVLEARYPVGRYVLEGGVDGADSEHCVEQFLSDNSTASKVIGSLSTLVHECGHHFDFVSGGFFASNYMLTPDLTYSCSGGGTPGVGGGDTFARSLINGDEYADLWPPCVSWSATSGCDSYGFIYLDGDPTDDSFEGGDQGFNMLLEEVVQYVNSLATGYAFVDQSVWTDSSRDGILTFFWYLERYLRLARTQYPETHQFLLNDTCWREAVLSVWGRGWFFLELSESYPTLGIDDDFLMELVMAPELLEEIDFLRDAQGCP